MANKQDVLNHIMRYHGITGEAVYPIYDWYNAVKGTHIAYGSPWCAMFLSYALQGVGYMPAFPIQASCDAMRRDFQIAGRWYTIKDKKPQVGDIIFFSNKNTASDCTHVGIVMMCDYYTDILTTYEGNTSKMVAPRMYPFTDNPYIVGYADIQDWYT
jgi:hypothetical protein